MINKIYYKSPVGVCDSNNVFLPYLILISCIASKLMFRDSDLVEVFFRSYYNFNGQSDTVDTVLNYLNLANY